MKTVRVYLSPSNQEHNAGVSGYGTEENQMHSLAHIVAKKLEKYGGRFTTRISNPDAEMGTVCAESNAFKADAHICIHTNAAGSSAQGTVAFYGSDVGKRLTKRIYARVSPVSPGTDKGVQAWPGLYEIHNTHAPVAYLELFFHSNKEEVEDYLKGAKEEYAEAIVRGLCDFFQVDYKTVTAFNRRDMRRTIQKAPVADLRWMVETATKELQSRQV